MNTPILIFSHNYLVNNWEEVVTEQLLLLLETKLYHNSKEIYYCVFSYEPTSYREFLNLVSKHDPLNKIQIIKHSKNKYEFLTLKFLQDTVQNKEDSNILYFHTKGTTSIEYHQEVQTNKENITSWRKIMEYFNIEKWEECQKNLQHSDIVGTLYLGESSYPYKYFFSGNFWWSKSSYIKTLPSIDPDSPDRMDAERWIGMSIHNWTSFWNSPGSHYETYFDPKKYRDEYKDK